MWGVQKLQGLISRALSALLADVPAERAVICYGTSSKHKDLKARIAYGMRTQNFWTDAPISLSVLRKCRQDGQPVLQGAVNDEEEALSVVLSGARSLLCVPFWDPGAQDVSGLIYADTSSPYKPFTREHFNQAVKLARQLESQLASAVSAVPPATVESAPTIVAPATPPALERPWFKPALGALAVASAALLAFLFLR